MKPITLSRKTNHKQTMQQSIDTFDFAGKRAIIRVDFNVPLDASFNVTDDTRIRAAIPTIKKVLAGGGSVILMSHLGRPKGAEEKYSLKHIIPTVEKLLGQKIEFAGDCMGADAAQKAAALKPGEVLLLENLRYYAEEEGKPRGLKEDATDDDKKAAKAKVKEAQKEFTKKLASYADCYINDAFGTAHRSHASTAAIVEYGIIKTAVCGFLIEKELSVMADTLENPKRPFVAILGGAKVADKLNVISNLLEKCDTLIIGGGMAYTFLKAKGYEVGTSLLDEEKIEYCKEMMAKAEKSGKELLLPVDAVVASHFPDPIDAQIEVETVNADKIPADKMGMDIGEKTRKLYADKIASAKSVIWNGPMGVFENPILAEGTKAVAKALADVHGKATTIIGGGDSAAAVQQLGFADKMSHISTGGGASLELFEGKVLPGIACLNEKK